mmetsp:Transcript_6643/g.11169  ORF Transcript_6643/g.11169 Transcript_6643/m.11169 type:complete len:98 (-) Transcript_6643:548-841(-)
MFSIMKCGYSTPLLSLTNIITIYSYTSNYEELIFSTQDFKPSGLFPPLIRPTSPPLLKQINVGIMATRSLLDSASQSSPSTSTVTNLYLGYCAASEV